ncbi:hypothetical protein ACN27F_31580 [Solwaraspora sp. WMMB335]|uniref:Rv0361 family membrane protein n=1 Tax=Solwaraspora sp. WMMB335 TaxID=3404118 RepID=UPI003B93CFE1
MEPLVRRPSGRSGARPASFLGRSGARPARSLGRFAARLTGPVGRQVGVVVAVFVLLAAVTALIGGTFLGIRQPAEEAARTAAATFLRRLAAGPPDAAYELLCRPVREGVDRSAFVLWAGRHPVADYWVGAAYPAPRPTDDAVAGPVVAVAGPVVAVAARLTGPDGGARVVEFHVVDERGSWRVCTGPWLD